MNRPPLTHLIAFLACVLALLGIAIPAVGFWEAFSQNAPSTEEMAELIPGQAPQSLKLSGYALRAELEVNQLNPADMTIEVLLRMTADNPDALGNILEETTDKVVFKDVSNPDKKFRDLRAQLRMETPFSPDVIVEIPLRRLTNFATLVRLPLQGDINRYPEDWYRSSSFAEVVLPDGLVVGEGPGGGYTTVPLNLALKSAPDTGLIIHYQLMEQEPPFVTVEDLRADSTQEFSLLIRRDRLSRAFVWTMALTPLLLLLVAISHRRNLRTAASSRNPFSLELAAALLAILPLRQVLVPPEVRGLTTVDFLLGTELAVFIALVVWQTGIGLWSESRRSGNDFEPS